jgi:exopolysaccharide biosynthesis operon protein EpsL
MFKIMKIVRLMNRWTRRLSDYRDVAKHGLLVAVTVSGTSASLAATDLPTADDGDSVKFYAADMETYDSNLYRLPAYISDLSALLGTHAARDDIINTLYAGLDGRWLYAKQSVTLNLRADENRFANNSDLNSTAGNANLNWNWTLGSRLTGQVGGDYVRALASFNETLYLGKDIVNSTDEFGTGRYQLGPHWTLIGGVHDADANHSANAARSNNFRSQSGNIGVELATDSADTLTWEYRYTNGHFPDGLFVFNDAPFDRDYNEDTVNFIVKHNISEKTQITANIGYDKRDYSHEPIGAFSGDIWRVSLQWQITEKTQIVAAGWRDLESYLASQSNYFVSTGASLSPMWVASENLSVSLSVSSIRQNYIPSSPTVVTLGTRSDRVSDEQVTIVYTPRRNLLFNLSFRNEQRSSNEFIFQYSDRLATASVTLNF